MKEKLLLLILSLIVLTATADQQAVIQKANTAYQAGFYENAAKLYEQVIKEGYASSELYYNLGNAYFKAEKFPSAILNYERAIKLDPSNEDINYNLKVANNQIIDKIDQLPKLFYERWWESLKQLLSPDAWAAVTIILFVVFFIVIAIFLLSTSFGIRRFLLISGLLLLFMTGIFFIFAYETSEEAREQREAIVFEPTLPVKSSPEETGIDLFVIHEGLKVQVIDELTGWREIRIANGSKGWVKSESLVAI